MYRSLSIQCFQLKQDYSEIYISNDLKSGVVNTVCQYSIPSIPKYNNTKKVADIELRSKAILTMFVNDVFFSKSFISIIPHLFHYCKCTQKYIQYNIRTYVLFMYSNKASFQCGNNKMCMKKTTVHKILII